MAVVSYAYNSKILSVLVLQEYSKNLILFLDNFYINIFILSAMPNNDYFVEVSNARLICTDTESKNNPSNIIINIFWAELETLD